MKLVHTDPISEVREWKMSQPLPQILTTILGTCTYTAIFYFSLELLHTPIV